MSLIKLATDFDNRYYGVVKSHGNIMGKHLKQTTGPYGLSALIGAGAGAGLGLISKKQPGGSIIGGLVGGLGGLAIASAVHHDRATRSALKNEPKFAKLDSQLKDMEDFTIYHRNYLL